MQNIRQKLKKNGLDRKSMLIVVEGKLNSNGEINYKYLVAPARVELFKSLTEPRDNSPSTFLKLKSLTNAYNQGVIDITKEVYEDYKDFLILNNSSVKYGNGCLLVKGVKRMYSHPFNNIDYDILIHDDLVFDVMDKEIKTIFVENAFCINR